VIIEGDTGFVYPMGDTDALARRLDELLADPDRCKAVAIRGGEAVRARFDWAIVGERYRALYDGLATRDPA
jgi:phosphatidylinositol alpha-mannosyltransferase